MKIYSALENFQNRLLKLVSDYEFVSIFTEIVEKDNVIKAINEAEKL